jgi:MMPL family
MCKGNSASQGNLLKQLGNFFADPRPDSEVVFGGDNNEHRKLHRRFEIRGTTTGAGLLFDILVVRSFMTPSFAALLGRCFWWPQTIRPRPASQNASACGTASAGTVLAAPGR